MAARVVLELRGHFLFEFGLPAVLRHVDAERLCERLHLGVLHRRPREAPEGVECLVPRRGLGRGGPVADVREPSRRETYDVVGVDAHGLPVRAGYLEHSGLAARKAVDLGDRDGPAGGLAYRRPSLGTALLAHPRVERRSERAVGRGVFVGSRHGDVRNVPDAVRDSPLRSVAKPHLRGEDAFLPVSGEAARDISRQHGRNRGLVYVGQRHFHVAPRREARRGERHVGLDRQILSQHLGGLDVHARSVSDLPDDVARLRRTVGPAGRRNGLLEAVGVLPVGLAAGRVLALPVRMHGHSRVYAALDRVGDSLVHARNAVSQPLPRGLAGKAQYPEADRAGQRLDGRVCVDAQGLFDGAVDGGLLPEVAHRVRYVAAPLLAEKLLTPVEGESEFRRHLLDGLLDPAFLDYHLARLAEPLVGGAPRPLLQPLAALLAEYLGGAVDHVVLELVRRYVGLHERHVEPFDEVVDYADGEAHRDGLLAAHAGGVGGVHVLAEERREHCGCGSLAQRGAAPPLRDPSRHGLGRRRRRLLGLGYRGGVALHGGHLSPERHLRHLEVHLRLSQRLDALGERRGASGPCGLCGGLGCGPGVLRGLARLPRRDGHEEVGPPARLGRARRRAHELHSPGLAVHRQREPRVFGDAPHHLREEPLRLAERLVESGPDLGVLVDAPEGGGAFRAREHVRPGVVAGVFRRVAQVREEPQNRLLDGVRVAYGLRDRALSVKRDGDAEKAPRLPVAAHEADRAENLPFLQFRHAAQVVAGQLARAPALLDDAPCAVVEAARHFQERRDGVAHGHLAVVGLDALAPPRGLPRVVQLVI